MSAAGLEMTRYCEGLYLQSYQDSRGVWTIGYGRIEYDDGTAVGPGETCTLEQAEAWLLEDVEKDGSHYVRAWVKTPLSQCQFDALSDFTFNRGAGRLETLLAMPGNIYDNFLTAVPDDTELGLQRRRRMNRAMYLGQDWQEYKSWQS
jgi:GH24 family phage-related lysozyme (muramidase)